jgi:hypothetical protein
MYRYLSRFGGLLLVSGLLGCSSTGGFLAYQPEELAGTSPFNLPNVAGEEIPLVQGSSGLHTIDVILNGKIKVEMLLDSGASDVGIQPGTALFLTAQAAATGKPLRYGPDGVALIADGTEVPIKNFSLNSLQIGTRVFTNVQASYIEPQWSDKELELYKEKGLATAIAKRFMNEEENPFGLLGQSVLERLGSYTIDYERNLLVLAPSAMHVPKLAMYPSTSQKSLQAVHHWDVLAEQEASRIVEELGATKATFFLESEGVGAFGKGFHALLTGHLVDKGRIVLSDERSAKINDAYRIKYKVQVVSHSEAAGTEVLVTTQVSHGERIMLSSSNVYYLQDQHKKNYKAPKSATPMKVVSG